MSRSFLPPSVSFFLAFFPFFLFFPTREKVNANKCICKLYKEEDASWKRIVDWRFEWTSGMRFGWTLERVRGETVNSRVKSGSRIRQLVEANSGARMMRVWGAWVCVGARIARWTKIRIRCRGKRRGGVLSSRSRPTKCRQAFNNTFVFDSVCTRSRREPRGSCGDRPTTAVSAVLSYFDPFAVAIARHLTKRLNV